MYTIRFPHKKIGPKDKDNRSKAKKKKDSTLAMLAPDLLSLDPHVSILYQGVLFYETAIL